ncbi:MAG: GerMN domain-containing protein [Spirochaetales bacterium]|jgi:hypothetical protein|nr:GerMN domain-containing protein [Spirochaetales bacterium]
MAKKAKSSLGVTFWVALLVFLGLLYAANRVDVPGLLGSSGSGDIVKLLGGDYNSGPDTDAPAERTPAAPVEESPPDAGVRVEVTEAKPRAGSPASSGKDESARESRPAAQTPPAVPAPRPAARPAETGTRVKPAATAEKPEVPAAVKTPERPVETAPKTREGVLYFIRLSDSGEITLTKTPREIRSTDAPLTDTLRTLAAGPTENESRSGCTSLIPEGSRLLSVTVRDGVAFVNFDESFRFNSFGREGYDGQLKQLVYTATEFPTIQAVQVLINGNKIDFLGSEGIYIGKPVGRKDI